MVAALVAGSAGSAAHPSPATTPAVQEYTCKEDVTAADGASGWFPAKVMRVKLNTDQASWLYLCHYTGWATRYDKWLAADQLQKKRKPAKRRKAAPSQAAAKPSQSAKALGWSSHSLHPARIVCEGGSSGEEYFKIAWIVSSDQRPDCSDVPKVTVETNARFAGVLTAWGEQAVFGAITHMAGPVGAVDTPCARSCAGLDVNARFGSVQALSFCGCTRSILVADSTNQSIQMVSSTQPMVNYFKALDSAIAPFDLSLNEKLATPPGSSLLEEAIGGMSTLLEYIVELESLCLQTHGTKNGQARQGMPSISVRKSFRQNQKSLQLLLESLQEHAPQLVKMITPATISSVLCEQNNNMQRYATAYIVAMAEPLTAAVS